MGGEEEAMEKKEGADTGGGLMFLDEMSTDMTPADHRLILRSFTRRLKRERARNAYLHYLIGEKNFHLKRLHKIVNEQRKWQRKAVHELGLTPPLYARPRLQK